MLNIFKKQLDHYRFGHKLYKFFFLISKNFLKFLEIKKDNDKLIQIF